MGSICFSTKLSAGVLLRFKTAALGDGVPGTTLLVNTNHADHGRLGLALACPIGSSISSGTRQIALVTFSVAKATGATTLDFADVPAFRETVDVSATPLAVRYETATPGLVNLLSVSVPEGGLPQLTVNGVPGQSYIIWASTDLIDWITLAVIPNFSSPFEFIDTDAPNYPARFYKVVAP